MKIFTKSEIEKAIDIPTLIQEIELGLILDAQKKVQTAPVSFIHLSKGDVHIKSGAILADDFYVIKIASGFYQNALLGLPNSNGLMLLFSQKTGELKSILLDEGKLTDLRTALAGAIAAKYLAPHPIKKIGIIGTGIQAREQLYHLQYVTSCRDVLVWGRDKMKAKNFVVNGFKVNVADSVDDVAKNCNLIVTATASTEPLLFGHQLIPGTHITAMGADDYGKQELDSSVFDRADLIVADSVSQCFNFGDLAHAKNINPESVVELGKFIQKPERQPHWITVADLTGISIEDLQIAKAVYKGLIS